MHKTTLNQEQAAHVTALHQQGLNNATIAKRLGLTKELVDSLVRTFGQ